MLTQFQNLVMNVKSKIIRFRTRSRSLWYNFGIKVFRYRIL